MEGRHLDANSLSLKDVFTNTRPLWVPPGARGIFGGSVIAQSLSAAQKTVNPEFSIHSMHCYFVTAGDSQIPIIYNVERVRDGLNFATRTVQARQKGKAVFTTTMSFTKEVPEHVALEHHIEMPQLEKELKEPPVTAQDNDSRGPFEHKYMELSNAHSSHPQEKEARHWYRARGTISATGDHTAHTTALAYMSDTYFLGTIVRAHDIWKVNFSKKANETEEAAQMASSMKEMAQRQGAVDLESKPEVSMMVSLDHSIYFHAPRSFRADEWMYGQMSSPWAGNDRGLVYQQIFTKNGKLIATCIQEGLIRIKQPSKL
ncbi:MAG: hypothetical protein M1814_001410 [Vezdaea aestivalis]|nr:MAG: hypothetical protein M1814_001410 [Vezdaea aestivalis]